MKLIVSLKSVFEKREKKFVLRDLMSEYELVCICAGANVLTQHSTYKRKKILPESATNVRAAHYVKNETLNLIVIFDCVCARLHK